MVKTSNPSPQAQGEGNVKDQTLDCKSQYYSVGDRNPQQQQNI